VAPFTVVPLAVSHQTLLFPASSALLVHTNQISSSFQSPKRFADTELLVSEFISFPPSSARSRLAISRINYLHSRYASRISNDQMLYVLGVFACNPCNWVDKYEWRTLDQMEVVAMGTYWKGIGEMMGIDLEPICGMAHSDPQYDHDHYDAINWMLDMQRYLDEHDSLHLGYNSDIDALVKPTMDLGLTLVPKPLKGVALDAGLTLFDERYRKAGGYVNDAIPHERDCFKCYHKLKPPYIGFVSPRPASPLQTPYPIFPRHGPRPRFHDRSQALPPTHRPP
jgi:hypothetical protein